MTAHAARVELQTNFSIKFFTYLLISLKLVNELFFVSFARLLRFLPPRSGITTR